MEVPEVLSKSLQFAIDSPWLEWKPLKAQLQSDLSEGFKARNVKEKNIRDLPNGRADVVVKVILDESTHNARFPNTSVLEKNEDTAMKIKDANFDLV